VNAALVEAYPAPYEVVIVPLGAGGSVRVHHPEGARTYTPDLGDVPFVAVIPGDKDAIGWGCAVSWYGSLSSARNGKHPLDRDAWHAAAKAARGGGVAYVKYVLRDHYGKPRWTANGYRWESAELASSADRGRVVPREAVAS
jgi:hypothetical protein